jgi:RNA 2',3'-cyclic 3'-phosphodiesterase
MARLFFALWPDEAAGQALAEVAAALAERTGGRPVPAAKIHLTLAFLGEIAADRAREACQTAAIVRSSGFNMVLDCVGSFRPAQVAWAGCTRVPFELASLHTRLTGELRSRGFTLEERPFAPHVTLARRISNAVPREPMPPLEWKGREMTLVRSETGTGRYDVLEGWPLGGA